ncbi:MAG: hypothetical protein Q7T48_05395 [Cellvibrio sp.]|uniref:hypothetical protein n=1 Tax=Cellvibrio sp. TaxID=1965322 RepID=UPI00272242EC|nr:hypothetical protein [Cellvibrio sp.]
MNSFMNGPVSHDDCLMVLKCAISNFFESQFIKSVEDIFVEGDIYDVDAEIGIYKWSEELNNRYYCNFYFEGYRAHLVSGQQCIVSEKTLKFYLIQAVEWAKENRPEHKQFLIDFERKYLTDVEVD